MTDQEIYQGILSHDRRVMEYVYRKFFPQISRYVLSHGGKEADAFDVFQDSIVALWVNVKTGNYELREDARLGTYLQGISKNVWRSKQRKEAKVPVVNAEIAGIASKIAAPEPEPAADSVIELEIAIAQLGEKCRRLLRLFYYEKASLREISTVMAYTEKTAKNNKYRCMRQLREKFKRTDV